MRQDTRALLQGTLGLLILKSVMVREQHGYGIARWIQEVSGDFLEVEDGSLYPALRRLEDRGLITARWVVTENNRRARLYALTAAGRTHLRRDAGTWYQFASAVTAVLRTKPSVI